MLHGDNPYYTNWLKDFFKNSGSLASLAQVFLIYWEGNSGDKLLERQTRATEWYFQIEKGFSQPNGGTAQSDPKALEAVRGDLYDNSVPGGGDGMGYAYGQCTWGVAARINQLGLKLKGRNGEKIPIISTMGNGQDWWQQQHVSVERQAIYPKQELLFPLRVVLMVQQQNMGMSPLSRKFTQMGHFSSQKLMSMAIQTIPSVNYQESIVRLVLLIRRNRKQYANNLTIC